MMLTCYSIPLKKLRKSIKKFSIQTSLCEQGSPESEVGMLTAQLQRLVGSDSGEEGGSLGCCAV